MAEPLARAPQRQLKKPTWKILSDADWGFRLEDVTYPNVKIWHGVRDRNTPIVMMRHLAGMMPSCTLYESDDTHYTMGNGTEAALGELVGGPKAKNCFGMRLRTRGN